MKEKGKGQEASKICYRPRDLAYLTYSVLHSELVLVLDLDLVLVLPRLLAALYINWGK